MNRLTLSSFLYSFLMSTGTACISMLSLPAHAEAPRWYNVEVALIGYQNNQKFDDENWPEVLTNQTPITEEDNSEDTTNNNNDDPWSWVSWWNSDTGNNNSQALYNVKSIQASGKSAIANAESNRVEATRIESTRLKLKVPFAEQGMAFEEKTGKFAKARNLQLLWSRKWQQPIPEKEDTTLEENAVKINFRTALNLNKALKSSAPLLEAEVTGEFYLYRSRYLHLVSNLTIQHWQSLDRFTAVDKSTNILPSHPTLTDNIIPSSNSTPLTPIDEIPVRAATINQSRRMRSNELHYIDHPMLGILVRVTPIEE